MKKQTQTSHKSRLEIPIKREFLDALDKFESSHILPKNKPFLNIKVDDDLGYLRNDNHFFADNDIIGNAIEDRQPYSNRMRQNYSPLMDIQPSMSEIDIIPTDNRFNDLESIIKTRISKLSSSLRSNLDSDDKIRFLVGETMMRIKIKIEAQELSVTNKQAMKTAIDSILESIILGS